MIIKAVHKNPIFCFFLDKLELYFSILLTLGEQIWRWEISVTNFLGDMVDYKSVSERLEERVSAFGHRAFELTVNNHDM